ncbi:MRNA cap guanine-N7 methyltransferase [Aphelenchoides besseyi]|nr:MRNA cap guanine-N7 methyltransferase [Aphelenchoides besseyi]
MNFVSEKDIEKKEGEEEEEYDGRPLYERLKSVRDKKTAEIEEERALKNQFRGIDDSEAQFLGMVNRVKAEQEEKKKKEIQELVRAQKAAMSTAIPSVPSTSFTAPKIQAGALKSKIKSANSATGILVRKRKHSEEAAEQQSNSVNKQTAAQSPSSHPTSNVQVVNLSGVVDYGSSSDDEEDTPNHNSMLKSAVSNSSSNRDNPTTDSVKSSCLSEPNFRMSSDRVAQHYNAIPNAGTQARESSKIYYMRNFNNWVKSMVIGDFLERLKQEGCPRARVLDLCCGKGGDLLKWKIGGIRDIVMTDVADVSLEHARDRYKEVKQRMEREGREPFSASFITADLGAQRLTDHYEVKDELFDLTSCQFAIHYSFASEPRAWQFLRNATERLRPGGYFIGTMPDARQILNLIINKGNNNCYENDVCRVDLTDKAINLKTTQPPLFGAQIYFALDQVVNCPEYLAYFDLLQRMLADCDMELVYMKPFSEIYKEYMNDKSGLQLMSRMKAVETFTLRERSHSKHDRNQYAHATKFLEEKFPNSNNEAIGTISNAEWEVISMYSVFAFRKVHPTLVVKNEGANGVESKGQ